MGSLDINELLFQRSGRLFATPSFMTGVARALDIGATFDEYTQDNTPKEADFWSLWSDWYAVGDDLGYALALYKHQQTPPQ